MKDGFLNIIPLAIGAAAYGFAFGVLAGQSGFPWWGVALMSATVHAGSSQIVAVERFASDGALLGAVLAGIALNLRYIGIIASLSEILRDSPLFVKLYAIHITGDENWALTIARRAADKSTGTPFLIGSGLTMIATWTISTSLGALAGQSIPDIAAFGVGFAFTAAFIAMARAMWSGYANLMPWLVSFFTTMVLIKFTAIDTFAVIIGSIFGVITASILRVLRSDNCP